MPPAAMQVNQKQEFNFKKFKEEKGRLATVNH
jgi:hypothetical protein